LTIGSDPDFYTNPWVSLNTSVPVTGNYTVAYKAQSSLLDILNDVGSIGGDLKYLQEASSSVERAVMRITGPSVNSIDDVLYGTDIPSIEDLTYRLNREHDEVGRHTTIRPDIINMEPHVSGVTVFLRNAEGEDFDGDDKLQVLQSDGSPTFGLNSSGDLWGRDTASGANYSIYNGGAWLSYDGDSTTTIELTTFLNSFVNRNSMLSLYNEQDGYDTQTMLTNGSSSGWATYAAEGLGPDGVASVNLHGNYQSEEFGRNNDGGAVISLQAGGSPRYSHWNLLAKAQSGSLTFCSATYDDIDEYDYNNLLYMVTDVSGAAVGIGYSQALVNDYVEDPGYVASQSGRASLLDVHAETYNGLGGGCQWPVRITRSSGTNAYDGTRNHYLAVREVRDGSHNPQPVKSGMTLGGLAMGGRWGASRGQFAIGGDGGCEITAIATTNFGSSWSSGDRGGYLEFHTTRRGHNLGALRAGIDEYGLSLYDSESMPVFLQVGTSWGAVGNGIILMGHGDGADNAASLQFGDDLSNRHYDWNLRGNLVGQSNSGRPLELRYFPVTDDGPFYPLTIVPNSDQGWEESDAYSMRLHDGVLSIDELGVTSITTLTAYHINDSRFINGYLGIGYYGSGNRVATFDLISSNAPANGYNFHMSRAAGVNGDMTMANRGTGSWHFKTGNDDGEAFYITELSVPVVIPGLDTLFGTSGHKWPEIHAQSTFSDYVYSNALYGFSPMTAPASQTDLVARHALNCVLACGRIRGSDGHVSSSSWNISSAVRNGVGSYTVTLTEEVGNASDTGGAYALVNAEILQNGNDMYSLHANFVPLTAPTHKVFNVECRVSGLPDDVDFDFVVIGRPLTLPTTL
jgi:hypothetical protein